MGAAKEIAKRIPLIKFPARGPRASSGNSGQAQVKQSAEISASSGVLAQQFPNVPASPKHQGFGGSASIQPHRTPVTDREIEAIMLGGA